MEFTLVGIGLIFVLIGIFEMSRGMWIYHTLAHTSKEATRYLIVHGRECQTRTNCATDSTLANVAARIRYHGVGLLPNLLELQVWRGGVQVVGSGGGFVTLASLESNATVWDAAAEPGQAVQVSVRYPFRSALAMFWPGAKRVNYTLVTLGANSWDTIQF
jgi:Flp pilus assembly protein TadG